MNTRIGVVGIGLMGSSHARTLAEGKVKGAELTAVCDVSEKALAALPYDVKKFRSHEEILKSPDVDAVIVATPHYAHTTVGIAALRAGKHLLTEKPISVHKADCEALLAAHKNKKLVFAAMFQMRTVPWWIKIQEIIKSGVLGEIRRINWIITDWFRSDAYYASSDWRATWKGEGGGVLLNQCPHNLDLWQWMFGMPSEVWSDCSLGKYHKIEVEDEVMTYMRYKSGATGVFITSTGEAPGTNRLEIAAENGRLVYENGQIEWLRNEMPMSQYCRTTPHLFSTIPHWKCTYPMMSTHVGPQHQGIMQNFVDAIRNGTPLIASAHEGIRSVELGNAMLMSSQTGAWVKLPLKSAQYTEILKKLIAKRKK